MVEIDLLYRVSADRANALWEDFPRHILRFYVDISWSTTNLAFILLIPQVSYECKTYV